MHNAIHNATKMTTQEPTVSTTITWQ